MGDIASESSEEPDTEPDDENKEEVSEETKKVKLSEMTPWERDRYLRE